MPSPAAAEQSHQQAMSSERFLANPEFTSIDSKIDREYQSAMYTMVCTMAEKAMK